jgi:hypothetical protein
MAIVDQASDVDADRAGWWSIAALAPIGQTFRPSLAGLDAIELWTEDQWDAECAGAGATLQVNIREAVIGGPLLGSSDPVTLPDCFKGVAFFGFPSFIAVTPEKTYAIEVIVTSQDNWGVIWQQEPESYPRGEALALGATSEADLWFRAGLRSPTPLADAYCLNGLWQQVRRANGSAFSDQDNCIQYVNTGR